MWVLVLGACGAKTGLEDRRPARERGDGGTTDAARRDAGEVVLRPSTRCMLDAPNARLTGTIPLGPIVLSFGWSGPQDGSCGGSILYFSNGPAPVEDEFGVVLPIRNGLVVGPADPAVGGEVTAHVTAVEDGERIFGRGLVRTTGYLEPGDDPRAFAAGDGFCRCDPSEKRMCSPEGRVGFIEGELAIEADGWSVHGTFRLPHCHLLHAICF